MLSRAYNTCNVSVGNCSACMHGAKSRQVICRESSKSLDSAVGTIFHLSEGGGQSNCNDTLLRWSGGSSPSKCAFLRPLKWQFLHFGEQELTKCKGLNRECLLTFFLETVKICNMLTVSLLVIVVILVISTSICGWFQRCPTVLHIYQVATNLLAASL